MIDIHCHLLPGIDDGPPSLDAALALARALVEDKVHHVVCTPHVFPGRFENRRSTIELEFAQFQQALQAAGIDLTLSFAGEVRLTPEVLPLLDKGELPFLGRTASGEATLLLEMPDGQIPLGSERFVGRLLDKNILPVLAHPERNRAVMEDPSRLEGFVEMGCMLQLTAASVVGLFGPKAHTTARTLLEAGWVHAVASDAHNLGGRKPRMSAAREWLTKTYGQAVARQLLVMGPAAISHRPVPLADMSNPVYVAAAAPSAAGPMVAATPQQPHARTGPPVQPAPPPQRP
jgi:protein-tyrosine phosphatase